jgi:hypothetical protein
MQQEVLRSIYGTARGFSIQAPWYFLAVALECGLDSPNMEALPYQYEPGSDSRDGVRLDGFDFHAFEVLITQ